MVLFLPLLLALIVFGNPAKAQSVKVDLELVIATDVSRSIDEHEARLQREGVAAALRSRHIVEAIQGGYHKQIALAYIDYSSRDYNEIIVDWRIIKDQTSADAFAKALTDQPLTYGRRTSISDALEMALEMIEKNKFEGRRKTIDVAGDGPNNHGRLVEDVRDEVIAKGITINGLPIINNRPGPGSRFAIPDLDLYYRGCVIGGHGAFLVIARDFPDFARAIRRKLIFELAGKPRPVPRLIPTAATGTPPSYRGTGYVYKPGCDIGERMWRQIWDFDDP